MDILRERRMANPIKIGILGLYPYLLGGYDQNNHIRSRHMTFFSNVLKHYKNVIGITGLTTGSELDFANVCWKLDIPFHYLKPYDNQSAKWLFDKDNFEMMESKAREVISVGNGIYSPSKVMTKNYAIIDQSDVIIYVPHPIYNFPSIVQRIYNNRKICYLCPT